MRKKMVMWTMLAVLIAFFAVEAMPAAKNVNTKKTNAIQQKTPVTAVPAVKDQGITPLGWTVIGVDVALAGLTVFAVLDERSAAEAYKTLLQETDNTTIANYDALTVKKKEIDGKIAFAGVSTGIMAAALLYTAADILWIHAAFPVNAKLTYAPEKGETKILFTGRF